MAFFGLEPLLDCLSPYNAAYLAVAIIDLNQHVAFGFDRLPSRNRRCVSDLFREQPEYMRLRLGFEGGIPGHRLGLAPEEERGHEFDGRFQDCFERDERANAELTEASAAAAEPGPATLEGFAILPETVGRDLLERVSEGEAPCLTAVYGGPLAITDVFFALKQGQEQVGLRVVPILGCLGATNAAHFTVAVIDLGQYVEFGQGRLTGYARQCLAGLFVQHPEFILLSLGLEESVPGRTFGLVADLERGRQLEGQFMDCLADVERRRFEQRSADTFAPVGEPPPSAAADPGSDSAVSPGSLPEAAGEPTPEPAETAIPTLGDTSEGTATEPHPPPAGEMTAREYAHRVCAVEAGWRSSVSGHGGDTETTLAAIAAAETVGHGPIGGQCIVRGFTGGGRGAGGDARDGASYSCG